MCLTTKQKWPKIAWKPITTYKVVYDPYNWHVALLTLIQNCSIQIGNTYEEPLRNIFRTRTKDSNIYTMKEGLHSYIEERKARLLADYFRCYNTIIVECTIPKFSLYWIGDDNDIVSNKLKYVKIL